MELSLFSEYTGLYFYSALLQANAAMLSIAGIFFIFKIQLLNNSLGESKTNLIQNRLPQNKGYVVEEFCTKTQEEQREKIDNWDPNSSQDLLNGFKKIHTLVRQINKAKQKIKLPSFSILIALVLNIISLAFASYIHSTSQLFELITIVLTIIIELIVLFIIIKAILSVTFDS